jgi:hypothetical protein
MFADDGILLCCGVRNNIGPGDPRFSLDDLRQPFGFFLIHARSSFRDLSSQADDLCGHCPALVWSYSNGRR